jgi:hypothetical protein
LGGIETVGTRFQVLRSQTLFRRYRSRRASFPCFTHPDTFFVVPRASGLVLKFCALGHVFGGTEAVGTRYQVLRSRTHIRRYRGRWGSFSYFALLDKILGFTEGVGSCFHVLRSLTLSRRYRGRGVQFSCFVLPDTFLPVPRASYLVFMLCAPGLFLAVTEGVVSRFHILRSRTHYRQYRRRHVPFSSFAIKNSFLTIPRASGLVFMFCDIGLFLGGIEAVGARFQVLRSRTHFGGIEGIRSRFHVLCSRTSFRQYRGRRVPFSSFSLPDSFLTVPKASGLV